MLHAYHEDVEYYADRADGLLASAQDGTAPAVAAFADLDAPLTAEGARRVVAAQHGLASWDALRDHVAGLRERGDPFAAAFRAIEAHDVDGLRARLDAAPELVRAQGTNGNDLLGMATATCDERLVGLLLERGADPGHANAHGWTPLHQAASVGLPRLVELLLDAGAPVDRDARGDGGTPLVAALFWGKRATAERVAARGILPRNLRTAAGLGELDLIGAVLADGSAGAHRGFYRPHGGFPAWAPADDPQQALDEALAWAARNDRAEALDPLVAHGADVAADVYRGTALAWAAAVGATAAIRRLVALGAGPSQRTTFGGLGHGQDATALHLAAQAGHLDAIAALLELGADPACTDGLYDATPAGWAEHGGQSEAAELLRRAA